MEEERRGSGLSVGCSYAHFDAFIEKKLEKFRTKNVMGGGGGESPISPSFLPRKMVTINLGTVEMRK